MEWCFEWNNHPIYNAIRNPINNNAVAAEKGVVAKKRDFEEVREPGLVGEQEAVLTDDELQRKVLEVLKEQVGKLHRQDKEKRDALLGVFLGTHSFNITISADNRREFEHLSKMQRPDPKIINKDGSRVRKQEYNAVINQVLEKSIFHVSDLVYQIQLSRLSTW